MYVDQRTTHRKYVFSLSAVDTVYHCTVNNRMDATHIASAARVCRIEHEGPQLERIATQVPFTQPRTQDTRRSEYTCARVASKRHSSSQNGFNITWCFWITSVRCRFWLREHCVFMCALLHLRISFKCENRLTIQRIFRWLQMNVSRCKKKKKKMLIL